VRKALYSDLVKTLETTLRTKECSVWRSQNTPLLTIQLDVSPHHQRHRQASGINTENEVSPLSNSETGSHSTV
jgi:hypothetical protein